MNTIFQKKPYGLLYVKWFDHQSQVVSQNVKNAEKRAKSASETVL